MELARTSRACSFLRKHLCTWLENRFKFQGSTHLHSSHASCGTNKYVRTHKFWFQLGTLYLCENLGLLIFLTLQNNKDQQIIHYSRLEFSLLWAEKLVPGWEP